MRSTSAPLWTREKIDSLTTPEIKQLRVNAERLNESAIATLCDQVLGARPRGKAKAATGVKAAAGAKAAAKKKPA